MVNNSVRECGMISKRFTITNERGIHLRPSYAIIEIANAAECSVIIRRWGETFSAHSLLRFMAAQIAEGEEIEIICDGKDEKEAMTALEKLIKSEFEEILKG